VCGDATTCKQMLTANFCSRFSKVRTHFLLILYTFVGPADNLYKCEKGGIRSNKAYLTTKSMCMGINLSLSV
jgi:hypothetical protein